MTVLPNNPLPALADEMLQLLPRLMGQYPAGVPVHVFATEMAAAPFDIRRGMACLDTFGRAKLICRGRGGAMHLVGTNYSGHVCIICHREFKPVRKETRTCSRSCARYWAWQNEDMRRRHAASVKAARAKPGIREEMSKIHRDRCAAPEVRQQMSERNRRLWCDPEKRVRRINAIKEAWRGGKADARREKASRTKFGLWSDPEWRRNTIEAMRHGKRGRFKRAVLKLVSTGCDAPTIAARTGLSIEQVKIIWRRAVRIGETSRKCPDGRRSMIALCLEVA
jgi:hypothetical protein